MNETTERMMRAAISSAAAANDRDIQQLGELLKSAKLNDSATSYFERKLAEHIETASELKAALAVIKSAPALPDKEDLNP